MTLSVTLGIPELARLGYKRFMLGRGLVLQKVVLMRFHAARSQGREKPFGKVCPVLMRVKCSRQYSSSVLVVPKISSAASLFFYLTYRKYRRQ